MASSGSELYATRSAPVTLRSTSAAACLWQLQTVLHELCVIQGRIMLQPAEAAVQLREVIEVLDGTVAGLRKELAEGEPTIAGPAAADAERAAARGMSR